MKDTFQKWRADPQAMGRASLLRAKTAIPRYIPIVAWLPKYERGSLPVDLIGGLTVWGTSVPTALAYASLAGVPAQAGLYTAMMALLAYAIFGTSRHLKVTASSTMAVMSAAVVAPLAAGDAATYAELSAMLALVIGVMLLLAGAIRLGFIADFLSKPIVTGFVFGLALVIMIGQAPKLFGVPGGSGNFFQQATLLIMNLDETNPYTLAISIASFALVFALRRWVPKIPAGLVLLVVSILVTTYLNLSEKGVSIVGPIPTGLPQFGLPQASLSDITFLIAGGAGMVFLAVGESLGTARAYAAKYKYHLDADQELLALGASNLATSISQGFAVDASLSTTATAENAGAKTQLSSLVTSGMLLLTVLLLAPFFTNLPNAVLGVLVIISVLGLLDVSEFRRYWNGKRTDFAVAVTALIGVITSDVLTGLIIAVLLALVMVIYRASRPYIAILGKVPGMRGAYGDIGRHPENETIPRLIIFRMDAPMFYFNANVADKQIRERVNKSEPRPIAILIDLAASGDLDIVSADMLRDLVKDFRDENIEVLFCQVRGAVRDRLRRNGVMEAIGEERVFLSVDAAVKDFSERYPPSADAAPEANTVTLSAQAPPNTQ